MISRCNYIECIGIPGSGKTTLCQQICERYPGHFTAREKFLNNKSVPARIVFFILLSLRYGFLYWWTMIRYIGFFKILRVATVWRGFIDYITIKYRIDRDTHLVLYDQGIITNIVSIGWRTGLQGDVVHKIAMTLLPEDTIIFYMQAPVPIAVARCQKRTKQLPYERDFTSSDLHNHFETLRSYLSQFSILQRHEEYHFMIVDTSNSLSEALETMQMKLRENDVI